MPARNPQRSRTDRLALGRTGEEEAARWLGRHGIAVRERNVRAKGGELDLVAEQDGLLVFVEVKTRHPGDFGDPAEAVTPAKRRRIVVAANRYLQRYGSRPPACRFDVVEVLARPAGGFAVRHIPDAFRPGWR